MLKDYAGFNRAHVEAVKKILWPSHVRQIILYGSYARGDFRPDSDVDIMILLDMSDLELKAYAQQLSYMTYDFNMDNDLDIKPIAKAKHIYKRVDCKLSVLFQCL